MRKILVNIGIIAGVIAFILDHNIEVLIILVGLLISDWLLIERRL